MFKDSHRNFLFFKKNSEDFVELCMFLPFRALTALYRIFLLCFNHVHLLATLICFSIVDLNYNVGALIFGNVIVFTGMLMLMLTPSNNNSKQNKGFSPREFIGLLCQ